MKSIFLIDVPNLAWRAFHTTGDLSYEGVMTGVVFGVLREVLNLQTLFHPDRFVFCFDKGESRRVEILESYKGNRKEEEKEKQEARKVCNKQIHLLRTTYLPALGFSNCHYQTGFEADDIIAYHGERACRTRPCSIVSTDQDLYQCLGENVGIWNPRKQVPVTADSFRQEWGIGPSQWADVKALAGCTSDNVPGVKGVGEKTAIKFLAGTLKPTSKAYQEIIKSNEIWERNLKLVRLPFPGLKDFDILRDNTSEEKWNKLLEELGMRSLFGRFLT